MQAGPYDSLKDVALKILQNKVSTIPIIHSSSRDGSFPQLLHLTSLSGILKCKVAFFFPPSLFEETFNLAWFIASGHVTCLLTYDLNSRYMQAF